MDDETMPPASSAGTGNRSPSPSTLRMLRLRSLSSLSDQLSEEKEVKAKGGTVNDALNEGREAGSCRERGQEREKEQEKEQEQGQGGKGGDGLPTLIPPERPNVSPDLKVSGILGAGLRFIRGSCCFSSNLLLLPPPSPPVRLQVLLLPPLNVTSLPPRLNPSLPPLRLLPPPLRPVQPLLPSFLLRRLFLKTPRPTIRVPSPIPPLQNLPPNPTHPKQPSH